MLNIYILYILAISILGFYIIMSMNKDLINMYHKKEKIIYEIHKELENNLNKNILDEKGGE